jgi:predicted Zn-dependent protease
MDHHDWTTIDVHALTRVAIQKCLDSRDPVAVEPGRYTAILEPQAVCDFTSTLFGAALDRARAERGDGPYASARRGFSKIGERIAERRIRVTADPMDPDLGYVPFDTRTGQVYGAATWVDEGTLKNLSYDSDYAVKQMGKNDALLTNGAYRIHGGAATMDDMISSTERGVLVTRFSNLRTVAPGVPLISGFTRDGLWLIEKGKISKAIKNFRFLESPLFALSNVVQVGTPVRVFHPSAPVVVPPLKVADFNFVSLADAV